MSPFIAKLILRLASKNAKYLAQTAGKFAHRSNASQKISHIARSYLGIKPKGSLISPPAQYKSAENIAITKAKEVLAKTKGRAHLPTEADKIYLEGERAKELWWLKKIRQDAGLD